ncbi:MAG: hypothetical protein JSW11_00520 [Candidatus Heimdallarchaeota archaeon]|nr:MAG: hypothetical protein JSW11_00520 [Candidatus Heimdallarchaeota archaeon]
MSRKKRPVIGQTGKTVLSKAVLRMRFRRKGIKYRYYRAGSGWVAYVCGPFHSRYYGVSAMGFCGPVTTDSATGIVKQLSDKQRDAIAKDRAKVALKKTLANNFSRIVKLRNMLYSDVDEADNVGNVDLRLLDEGARNVPITEQGK